MKIMIKSCSDENKWYAKKIGVRLEAHITKSGYATKKGVVDKEDAIEI